MSLLGMPVAASITISRSRPESGTGLAVWISPGVAAPSQVEASTLERRSAAAAARWSPARLNASAAADEASAASSIAPRDSKSSAAPASSGALRARAAAAWRARADTSGESHMLASSRNRADVSLPLVRIRSCRSHASVVRCPVEAACAAASRNRSAASTGRRDARAVHASA